MYRFVAGLSSAAAICLVALIGYGSLSTAVVGAGPSGAALRPAPAAAFHVNLASVSFASAADGWAAGGERNSAGTLSPSGYLFRTTNSGKSWTRETVHWVAQQMQFISSSQGWAVVTSPANCDTSHCMWAIVATRNGGTSWALQLNGGRCWQIQSMDFITSQEGWAIESNSPCKSGAAKITTRIMSTVNGGATWQKAFQPGPRLTSVHFASALNGWATADGLVGGNVAHCRTTVYNKSDMGQTWAEQLLIRGYCNGYVDFVSARYGWVLVTNVGACAEAGCIDSRLYQTTNGGNGWTVEKKAWNGAGCGFLQQPHFVSSTTGYIAVTAGAVAAAPKEAWISRMMAAGAGPA